MVALITAALLLAAGLGRDGDTASVWLAQPGGKLTRAARDGTQIQSFDASPTGNARLFRGRQFAFTDGPSLGIGGAGALARANGTSLVWITSAGARARADIGGKSLIGWRDTEPLLWDGTALISPKGQKLAVDLRGDEPVFASFFGDSGSIVSRTSAGTLRVTVTGSPSLSADFGKWALLEARTITSTSGFLLLDGEGSAVLRIAKGRADLVALDREHKLGIAVASDGRSYIARLTAKDSDVAVDVTDIDEVGLTGSPQPVCQIQGHAHIIDIDRTAKCVYCVEDREQKRSYLRISYGSFDPEVTLTSPVDFVTPGFGGAGYVRDAGL